MQQITVIIILVLAMAYTGYRIYKALANKNGGCYGCPLNDVCKKGGKEKDN